MTIQIVVNGKVEETVAIVLDLRVTADDLWFAANKFSGDITLGTCTDFVEGTAKKIQPLFWDNSIIFKLG